MSQHRASRAGGMRAGARARTTRPSRCNPEAASPSWTHTCRACAPSHQHQPQPQQRRPSRAPTAAGDEGSSCGRWRHWRGSATRSRRSGPRPGTAQRTIHSGQMNGWGTARSLSTAYIFSLLVISSYYYCMKHRCCKRLEKPFSIFWIIYNIL